MWHVTAGTGIDLNVAGWRFPVLWNHAIDMCLQLRVTSQSYTSDKLDRQLIAMMSGRFVEAWTTVLSPRVPRSHAQQRGTRPTRRLFGDYSQYRDALCDIIVDVTLMRTCWK